MTKIKRRDHGRAARGPVSGVSPRTLRISMPRKTWLALKRYAKYTNGPKVGKIVIGAPLGRQPSP